MRAITSIVAISPCPVVHQRPPSSVSAVVLRRRLLRYLPRDLLPCVGAVFSAFCCSSSAVLMMMRSTAATRIRAMKTIIAPIPMDPPPPVGVSCSLTISGHLLPETTDSIWARRSLSPSIDYHLGSSVSPTPAEALQAPSLASRTSSPLLASLSSSVPSPSVSVYWSRLMSNLNVVPAASSAVAA